MTKAECMIKGYELGKNTRLHGEIKLAKEIAEIVNEIESQNLCERCIYGAATCDFIQKIADGTSPVASYINKGYSSIVQICDKFNPEK